VARAAQQELLPLLSKHEAFVRSQLKRFGASASALDDLTQEVWLVSLARSPHFPDERALRAWLVQVCRRVAAGERRSRVREPLLHQETFELPVAARQTERIERVASEQERIAALASLTDEQLDVLALYGSGELSMREVADLIGAPEATVYSRYRAAVDEVNRKLRRSERVGPRTSSAPPPRISSYPPNMAFDREQAADEGKLVIYRNDADMVLGRLGNVVVTRWRKRLYEQTVNDLESAMALVSERMNMPLVLVNDGDPDVRLPNAAERAALRKHIRWAEQVAIAVDIFDSPITHLISALISGIIMVTRSNTSFVMLRSLEAARRWVEPHARSKRGRVAWEDIVQVVAHFRQQP
jgi:RNA polymerase sigma-70 factor (ECF subfamily)